MRFLQAVWFTFLLSGLLGSVSGHADNIDELARLAGQSRAAVMQTVRNHFKLSDKRVAAFEKKLNESTDVWTTFRKLILEGRHFSSYISEGHSKRLDAFSVFFDIAGPSIDDINSRLSTLTLSRKLAIQKIGIGFYKRYMDGIRNIQESPIMKQMGDSLYFKICIERLLKEEFDLEIREFYELPEAIKADFDVIRSEVKANSELHQSYEHLVELVDGYFIRALEVARFFFEGRTLFTPVEASALEEKLMTSRQEHLRCYTEILRKAEELALPYQSK